MFCSSKGRPKFVTCLKRRQQNQAQRIFERVEKVVCKTALLHRHGRTSSQVSTEISSFSCIPAVWILKFISQMAIVLMYAVSRRVPPTQPNGYSCSFATMAQVRGRFLQLFLHFLVDERRRM